jgi:CP family cyanate transporter-like MFS transporter
MGAAEGTSVVKALGRSPHGLDVAGLVALFASALALRPQLVGVGPLLERIQADLHVPHAVLGLLVTIPVLCMGAFAPAAPFIAARLGPRVGMLACLALIATTGLARAAAPNLVVLLTATFLVGVGLGVAGAVLPSAVKAGFPTRPAFATGVYASGIQLGAALAAVSAAPLAIGSGWRFPLAVFSVATLVPLVCWWLMAPKPSPGARRPPRVAHAPYRRPIVWWLAAVFALQAIPYYGLNAWLPAYLSERQWAETTAGGVLALVNACGLVGSLAVPWVADRMQSRRVLLAGSAALLGAAIVGMLVGPAAAWVWSGLAGFGLGALFPLALTLPLDVSDTPEEAGAVAGVMLLAGYLISAFAPTLLGFVRDLTHGFGIALGLLAANCLALMIASWPLSRRRLQRGDVRQLSPLADRGLRPE